MRVTSAPQRMPTTPHNGNQLNTPTQATTSNPPTGALYMYQDRTRHMHHSTTHATKVAPVDKQSPAPTETNHDACRTFCVEIGAGQSDESFLTSTQTACRKALVAGPIYTSLRFCGGGKVTVKRDVRVVQHSCNRHHYSENELTTYCS